MFAVSHGGPDALGVPLHDFSTNSNACGPCPHALAAVQSADATRYPDPAYTALRARLAARHGVAVERVVIAASASEFIHRFTAWVAQQRRWGQVGVPAYSYADYAAAAQVHGLGTVPLKAHSTTAVHLPGGIKLLWCCEPSSPLGQADAVLATVLANLRPTVTVVVDCVYAPLRLQGASSLGDVATDAVWQLHSPNKALGLTGIRAAYAIAPAHAHDMVQGLLGLAPSWPLGAHGVALLNAWCDEASADWLHMSLDTLRCWKDRQLALCAQLGWQTLPSDTNFFCAQPGGHDVGQALVPRLAALRARGIKLRDATSLGLPGWVRLGVLSPPAQDALARAWRDTAPFSSFERL